MWLFGFRNATKTAAVDDLILCEHGFIKGIICMKEELAKAKKPYLESTATKTRKPYEKPTATKLTPEQAKLKLLGAASMGNQGAKELLEMMFPEQVKRL